MDIETIRDKILNFNSVIKRKYDAHGTNYVAYEISDDEDGVYIYVCTKYGNDPGKRVCSQVRDIFNAEEAKWIEADGKDGDHPPFFAIKLS